MDSEGEEDYTPASVRTNRQTESNEKEEQATGTDAHLDELRANRSRNQESSMGARGNQSSTGARENRNQESSMGGNRNQNLNQQHQNTHDNHNDNNPTAIPNPAANRNYATFQDTPGGRRGSYDTEGDKEQDIGETLAWWELFTLCFGFMISSYQLFVTGIVGNIFEVIHGGNSDALNAIALAGPLFGQIIFGFLADRFGRKSIYSIVLIVQILSSALSTFVFPINGNIWVPMTLCRFLVGIGCGGEYPLTAVIAAEKSSPKRRGLTLSLIIGMEGLGVLLAPAVVWCLVSLSIPLDWVWRLAFAFGTLGQVMVAFPRTLLRPSDTFSEVEYHTKKPVLQWFSSSLRMMRKYGSHLIGSGIAWFIFDITFFGNSFFQDEVLGTLGLYKDKALPNERIQVIAEASMATAAVGLPGFWLALGLIDRVGRKRLQLIGFAFMVIGFLAFGLALDLIVKIHSLYLLIYGLTFLFSHLGPNTTTFIVPAEVFPTEIRAASFGICAATGKLGGIIGVSTFEPLARGAGIPAVFICCSVLAFFGLVFSYAFVSEKSGKRLKTFLQRRDSLEKLVEKQARDIQSIVLESAI